MNRVRGAVLSELGRKGAAAKHQRSGSGWRYRRRGGEVGAQIKTATKD
jgi:hypothetical protein